MTGLDIRRIGRITGSRIGAILGLNQYASRADVLREMVREANGAPKEFVGNDATRYGQEHEKDALAEYERYASVLTYGGGDLIIHPLHDFLAITPDGLVADTGMVECKCPTKYSTYTHWSEKPSYEAQMRLQMEVAKRKWCDFVVWRDGLPLSVSRIYHDPEWIGSKMPVLTSFMAEYKQALDNPDQYLTEKVRTDSKWRGLEDHYLRVKNAITALESELSEVKEKLICEAGEAGAKGGRLQVTRCERTGSIAYAKAIKDLMPGADLSAYVGKPTTYYTIKESN